MRTTLTLDDDVSSQLKRLQEKQKKSFKEMINEVLRAGLRELSKPDSSGRRFRTKSVDLGQCSFGGVDDVAEVLAVAEGDTYR